MILRPARFAESKLTQSQADSIPSDSIPGRVINLVTWLAGISAKGRLSMPEISLG